MTTYTAKVNTLQYAAFCARLGKRFLPAVKKGVLSGALRSLEVVRSNTEHAPPACSGSTASSAGAVDTRHYLRGWKAQRTITGAVIFNDSPYAGVVELGRRPGSRPPPSHLLIPWVRRKMHLTESEAVGVAFVLSRAIGKRGQEPRRVLDMSIPDIVKFVDIEIGRELQKELAKP